METAELQRNINRAIRFERDPEDKKAKILIDATALEVEVFVRVKGTDADPTLLGTYPVSDLKFGES